MKKETVSRFLPFIMLLLCLACSVGPDYQPPIVEVSASWKNGSNTVENPVFEDYWWEIFEDPQLNALEVEALENNYDLYISFNRIQAARGLLKGVKAELYPHVFLNPAYNNTGFLYESYTNGHIKRVHEVLYLLPFNLSYELDLWGKIRSQYDAARFNWEAQSEAFNATLLILTAELASVYYQLRTLDAQIDLLEATLKTRQRALKINQSRFKLKIIDYTDVTFAGLEASNTLAQLHEVQRLRAELENRLAVLIGTSPSEFRLGHSPLQGLPPLVPAGIPSEVLMRRPDIAQAERQMAAEHALVKSAYASFFPSISLTAALGYASPHLKFFLSNFSRLWAFGIDSSQMIFDAGQLCADLAIQKARFNEASANYQQQVLICFEEVENALSNLDSYEKEFNDIVNSVEWATKNYKLANARYNKGVTLYLEVVESEQAMLASEMMLNDLRGLRFITTIQFITALGGGWNEL